MELHAQITEDGALSLAAGETQQDTMHETVTAARKAARSTAAELAREIGEPVRLVITDPSGLHVLRVTETGTVSEERGADTTDPASEVAGTREQPRDVPPVEDSPDSVLEDHVVDEPAAEAVDPVSEQDEETPESSIEGLDALMGQPDADFGAPVDRAPEVAAQESGAAGDRAPEFLDDQGAAPEQPAEEGWQGWVNRTFGMRLAPSPQEAKHRRAVASLQQPWIGPRTIVVLNNKGGANKTPTTVRLAAEVARAIGGGVLAWDNNQSMGSLGWRVEREDHGRTVFDLIRAAPSFLTAEARRADLAHYVHHQGQDMFDALISDDDPAHDHEVSGGEVDLIHTVASRNWRLIVMDSGNNARGENFDRMIHHADQIVLATTTLKDRAQGAANSWRALAARGGRAEELARNAVVIVSDLGVQSSPGKKVMTPDEVRAKFEPYVRAVEVVPFDPALVEGVMRAQDLKSSTRRAWQAATATVIQEFRNTEGRTS